VSMGLQELKELVASYQTLREGGRGPAITSTIISTARQCNMEKDCQLPGDETDTKVMSLDDRDDIVGKVYQKCAASLPLTVAFMGLKVHPGLSNCTSLHVTLA
jgi:cobalamin biosynthesis Mg chelatase CobN